MKLLIVEDNNEMRRLIKSIVGTLAETVYECSDGCQALASYTAHQPDVVLMDIEMKEMDGIRATRALMASFPEARVIIVTNYDDQNFRAAARAAGAWEYLVKDNLLDLKRLFTALSREQAEKRMGTEAS